ncbi:MAG: fumarylacetoacetate hydrolase family protein [Chloroflexi bacterium]|nr:fumarylacetoacetate hydrolase family protein [Chloroflexota bacterium]
MRFIRFINKGKLQKQGWVNGELVGEVEGNLFEEYRRLEAIIPLEEIKLCAPIKPGKIIGVGRNYVEHAKEQGVEVPQTPLIFLKPPSSVIGPLEKILLPIQSQRVEHEAELVVVIGKTARWIEVEKACEYVFGYTIGNDVTARDLQHKDGQWTRSKGFDTFCPIGPWIETDLDFSDTLISCRVNGELRQMASTREMVFTVPQLIAYITSIMTLEPGDLIFTGTPAGIGLLTIRDHIEIEIEGIGILKNDVAE